MGLQTFKQRYCEIRGVKADAFTKSFILETCYPQARSYYNILISLGEARIEAEVDLLHDLEATDSLDQLETMINGVYFANYLKSLGNFRKKLKLRLSGSKIVKVGQEVFEA